MINNAGFEERDPAYTQVGLARYWTRVSLGTAEERANIEGDSSYGVGGYEGFEHGWTMQDPQVTLFGFIALGHWSLETFFGWLGIDDLIIFGPSAAAAFDGNRQAVEDFENLWGQTDANLKLYDDEIASYGRDAFDWTTFIAALGSVESGIVDVFDWPEE